MKLIIYLTLVLVFAKVQAKFHAGKVDSKELKCLVCRTTIKELNEVIAQIDPTHKMDVGGYRIDPQGNLKQKQVSKAKSEIHLSELAGNICGTMDNYIRGTWKDDGTLTVFKLIENGQMSPKFSLVDIIQDDDLNKSLKYYCEEIMEEYEEHIVQQYISEVENIEEMVCRDHTNYCTYEDFIEKEHLEVPGTENDFAEQLAGLNKDFEASRKEELGEEEEEQKEELGEEEEEQKEEETLDESFTDDVAEHVEIDDVKDEL